MTLRIVFWILFCCEFVPAVLLAAGAAIGVLTGYSLNGMLLLIVPAGVVAAFVACIGAWFYFTSSKFALAVLCLPLLLVPVLLVQNQLAEQWTKQEDAGNLDFKQPGKQRLANAIVAADLQAVKAAIPGAGELNIPGERGLPILHFALQPHGKNKPNPQIIKALLDAGADPNGACAGATSLTFSCTAGSLPLDETKDFEIVKLLVEHGADPNKKGRYAPVWFNAFGDFYGPVQDGDKMFDLYLAHGLRLEGIDSRGNGPVAAAAFGRDWHSLRIMLERGIDPAGVKIVSRTLSEHLHGAADAARSYGKIPADLEASIRIVDKR